MKIKADGMERRRVGDRKSKELLLIQVLRERERERGGGGGREGGWRGHRLQS